MHLDLSGVPLPIRLRPDTPMSDGDLLRFCADNENLRVEREANGEIFVMTPAGNRTGKRNSYIVRTLGNWTEQDGRGYCFDSSTGFTLSDGSMRSPDAAWCLAEIWDTMSEQDKDRFSPICPEFIIELRSQSDRLPDLRVKMEHWITNGAKLAWLVDPIEKTVSVYRPNESPEIHTNPTSIQGTGPVRGFELVLLSVWE